MKLERKMQFKSDEDGNIFFRYCYILGDTIIPVDSWMFYCNANYC